ncbi:hypothetical protein ACEWY4_001720 [Coilia grayii]|uniref:IPT/TIG domain-containing protein n=1 Tax=Coilia grayii TaxID=363190 RepID=A0ABD1KTT9_9TELE
MGTAFVLFYLAICRYTFCEETHLSSVDGDIVDFAFGTDNLFLQTDTWLYQMRFDFSLDISNATIYNTMVTLVPFISNGTLIICGSHEKAYCEVLDINDISKSIYMKEISIGSFPNVAFIIGRESDKYLLVAKKESQTHPSDTLVTLRSTNDLQYGKIFSKSGYQVTAGIQPKDTVVQVIDGFQLTESPHVCLLVNVMDGSESRVKLLSLDSSMTKPVKTQKEKTFETLQGAVLQCYEKGEWMLLSSAVIPGESPVLWAGVFQDKNNPVDSVVAIFDISRTHTGKVSGFCTNRDSCEPDKDKSKQKQDKVLKPAAVMLRNSSITSVAVLRSNSWVVLFCGTKTGLLIRVVLDESLEPGCPTVLYSSEEDRLFSPKMLFNPGNHTHIYLAQGKQMRKIPVAQCGVYETLTDCWSALDPFCGWCGSKQKCTFQHDCSSSEWVSVPGTSQRRETISVHMNRGTTGQDIVVTALPNLNSSIDFSCAVEECGSPGPSPCSCTLSSDSFPAQGLSLRINITVQRETHIQEVHLKNCPSIRGTPTSALCIECISAGCTWSDAANSCTWRPASTAFSAFTQDVCEALPSGQNETKPEILYMTPSEVSIHGRNGASITGQNLKSVTKVRFQGTLDCSPKESAVRHSGNSSSESLVFDIPAGTKGTVRVCVVSPDDQCHGNAKLTYNSPPICRGLQPKNTWASGGRNISIVGSRLKFVERVKHDDLPADMTPELISETLVYPSPPGVQEVSVNLIVGNQSVSCTDKLTYLPDPHFTSFTTTRTGNYMAVIIQKTADSLALNTSEILVEGLQGEKSYVCEVQRIKHSHDTSSVICEINNQPGLSIDTVKVSTTRNIYRLAWDLYLPLG